MSEHSHQSFIGQKGRTLIRALRNHYLSEDAAECDALASEIRDARPDADVDALFRAATIHYARAAARDGAIASLLPPPFSFFVDYTRTTKKIANLVGTMERLKPNPDDRTMSLVHDSLGESTAQETEAGREENANAFDPALRDLSMLGGLGAIKLVGRRGRRLVSRGLRRGPLRKWWLRPLTRPAGAALWNYVEVELAGRAAASSAALGGKA